MARTKKNPKAKSTQSYYEGRPLPTALYDVYEWTENASELEELRDLRGAALKKYARESVANADQYARDMGKRPWLAESDILELAEWLRANPKANPKANPRQGRHTGDRDSRDRGGKAFPYRKQDDKALEDGTQVARARYHREARAEALGSSTRPRGSTTRTSAVSSSKARSTSMRMTPDR